MSDRGAPRLFVSYAHDSEDHKAQVHRFAAYLRAQVGLDVHLDLWYDNERRDWSSWAVDQLARADFILVIASPEYRKRAGGTAAPEDGRGSQFEAAMIRDNLTRNLRRETARVLPVVLRGRSVDDIPAFLNAYSTTRFHVDELTEAGVAALLAAITGHGQYPMPRRGRWRGGTTDSEIRLTGLPWLAHSTGVRAGPARIDGVDYEDSIVLRAASPGPEPTSVVDVELGGRFQRMTSVVGILDDATEPFQVGRFRVCVDGWPVAEGTVAYGGPHRVDVDLAGAMRLRLELHRPGVTVAPLLSPTHDGGRARGGPPELAWGNPTLR